MAFRASSLIPSQGYNNAKAEAIRTKNTADSFIADFATGSDADKIYSLLRILGQHYTKLTSISQTPGIVAYAQEQEADESYDVAAEFVGLLAEIETAINWLKAAIPTSDGYELMYTRSGGTTLTARFFGVSTLAPLVILLQNISDSVE